MFGQRNFSLLALSPLDGRYAEQTGELADFFSECALIKYRIELEIKWFMTITDNMVVTKLPPLSDAAKSVLIDINANFSVDDAARVKEIEQTTRHDVKAIEYFIKEKVKNNKEINDRLEFIHFGITSEDINNLAYGLMLFHGLGKCFYPQLDRLEEKLKSLSLEYANVAMLARTHGQPATPTTLGKEFSVFCLRLAELNNKLKYISIKGKLNGATGNYSALVFACPEVDWVSVSEKFINNIGLDVSTHTTQIEPHDHLIEFFDTLKHLSTLLMGLDQDLWRYISDDYLKLKSKPGEVGSSTMPHKVNPIDFENSEGNLGMAIAIFEFMGRKLGISRLQRDLSDSTVLRNIGSVLGYTHLGLSSLMLGLSKIEPNLEKMRDELNSHWELLAEPIQTVMRRHGIENSYEQLKFFSRDKVVTKEDVHDFIQQTSLPGDEKERLLALTPETYTGLASKLAAGKL